MSTNFAKHEPATALTTNSGNLASPFCEEGMSAGMAQRGSRRTRLLRHEPQLPAKVPADTLTNLDALPWLARSGSSVIAIHGNTLSNTPVYSGLRLLGGIAAIFFAAVCGGAWYLEGETMSHPAREVAERGTPSAGASASAGAQIDAYAVMMGQTRTTGDVQAEAHRALIAGEPGAEYGDKLHHRPAGMNPPAPTQSQMPLIDSWTAIAPVAMTDTATNKVLPSSPGVDSPAAAATLKEYRSTVEECRDAISAVIRLGDAKRPARNASAVEQTAYRLRQQNAEAAKGYRSYLDTLARAMRGAKSETIARQSLERARQTLGYVNTMLADSKASLR